MGLFKRKDSSRRTFMTSSGLLLTGVVASAASGNIAPALLKGIMRPNSLIKGVQIGVITYSFRSMPDQSAEATLKYVLDSGINAIELMGGPAESFAGAPENPVDFRAFFGLRRKQRSGQLTEDEQSDLARMEAESKEFAEEMAAWRAAVSMDHFTKLRKMYNDAGVSIYGFKPRAFEKNSTEEEMKYGFRAAKALGASHITLEHPSDDAHTLKLGRLGEKYKVYVGYHGHEQQTPTFWDTALTQSSYNALNIDIGHYVAAGNPSPLKILKEKHGRVMSMHVKDRQTPENGKANLPFGQGDTPIADVLRLMRDKQYSFPATIELEYPIPEGSDAVQEVGKCLEYCRRALDA